MEITSAKKRKQFMIRARRTRAHIRHESSALPRLSVFRSGKHIYAQIIDDLQGITIVSMSDVPGKTEKKKKPIKPLAAAADVGSQVAKKALLKNILAVVFDRGGYKYHGRVKALAEAARKAGLRF